MEIASFPPATEALKISQDYQDFHHRNPFHHLVQDIKKYLETSSAIGGEDIDVNYLKGLMNGYSSNPEDWQRYAYADPSKHYTRNCVANINGKANIMILVWNPSMGSPVHDHARAHCVMKILQGTLKEELFTMPLSDSPSSEPLQVIQETIYNQDDVAYVCDTIGLHRISNTSKNKDFAVSLHLYTPPNAADHGYHIYDEKTGKRVFICQAKAQPVD